MYLPFDPTLDVMAVVPALGASQPVRKVFDTWSALQDWADVFVSDHPDAQISVCDIRDDNPNLVWIHNPSLGVIHRVAEWAR